MAVVLPLFLPVIHPDPVLARFAVGSEVDFQEAFPEDVALPGRGSVPSSGSLSPSAEEGVARQEDDGARKSLRKREKKGVAYTKEQASLALSVLETHGADESNVCDGWLPFLHLDFPDFL